MRRIQGSVSLGSQIFVDICGWDAFGGIVCGKGLHDELLAREKSVGDELAGSHGDRGVGHDCVRVCLVKDTQSRECEKLEVDLRKGSGHLRIDCALKFETCQ